MRTIQDYRSIYSEIGANLGLRGDALEVLVQLLSQASYISEVEQVVYVQEASLEKATLVNSKIQHCMNLMYSVYRGSCPRVILNIHPTKYFTLNPYDVLVTSNNFKIYYLGYWDGDLILDPNKTSTVITHTIDEDPHWQTRQVINDVYELPDPSEYTDGFYYRLIDRDQTTYWVGVKSSPYTEIPSIPSSVIDTNAIYDTSVWPLPDGTVIHDDAKYIRYLQYEYYRGCKSIENNQNTYFFQKLDDLTTVPEGEEVETVDILPQASVDTVDRCYQILRNVQCFSIGLEYELIETEYDETIPDWETVEELPEPSEDTVDKHYIKIYIAGHYQGVQHETTKKELKDSSLTGGFVYSEVKIEPDEEKVIPIIGLIAAETVDVSHDFELSNPYYVETATEENLSNDVYVTWKGKRQNVTRNFSDHIISGSIYDLTIPSYGSRLYVPVENDEESTVNTHLDATYFRYSYLSDYNEAEIKKIYIRGAELVKFPSVAEIEDPLSEWSEAWKVFADSESEVGDGILTVKEGSRDSLVSIHYKANRDRYVNSILRTNSDVTSLLEEMYPDFIVSGGTSYKFVYSSQTNQTTLTIWYVPKNRQNLLTSSQIEQWKDKRTAYYVTASNNYIDVLPGNYMRVIYSIDLELYRVEENSTLSQQISDIFSEYENKFNISLEESDESIRSLISKISNVRQIISMEKTYVSEDGESQMDSIPEEEELVNTYFDIVFNLNTKIQDTIL